MAITIKIDSKDLQEILSPDIFDNPEIPDEIIKIIEIIREKPEIITKLISKKQELIQGKLLETGITEEQTLAPNGDEQEAKSFPEVNTKMESNTETNASDVSNFHDGNQSTLNFISKLVAQVSKDNANPQLIYDFLENNLEQLNDDFPKNLESWASDRFSRIKKQDRLKFIDRLIKLSNLVKDFPQGEKAIKQEIALTGYNIVEKVLSKEKQSEIWAENQHNLGDIYLERERGNRADNIEKAIEHLKIALDIYTPEKTSSLLWASLNNSLSKAYLVRMNDSKEDNLENSRQYSQTVLNLSKDESLEEQWTIALDLFKKTSEEIGQLTQIPHPTVEVLSVKDYGAFITPLVTLCHAIEAGAFDGFVNLMFDLYQQEYWFFGPDLVKKILKIAEEQEKQNYPLTASILRIVAPNMKTLVDGNFFYYKNFLSSLKNQTGININDLRNIVKQCFNSLIKEMTENTSMGEKIEKYGNFLDRIFALIPEGEEQLYPLLEENIEEIELDFINFSQSILEPIIQKLDRQHSQIWGEKIEEFSTIILRLEKGDSQKNLRLALGGYEIAVKIFTAHNLFQQQWITRKKLAEVNLELASPQAAVECYSEALQNITPDNSPQDYADIQYNLGISAQVINDLEKSRNALAQVIQTGAKFSNQIEEDLVHKSFSNIIDICINLNNEDQALEYVEGYKNYLLKQFLITNQIQLPDFLNHPLNFSDIKGLLPDDKTAIIELYVKEKTIYTFIITSKAEIPLLKKIEISKDFSSLLNPFYQRFKYPSSKKEIDYELSDLGKQLGIKQIILDISSKYDKLIIIPHSHLQFFPIHAFFNEDHAFFNEDRGYVLDQFERGCYYLPSCQLLPRFFTSENKVEFNNLLALSNSADEYSYADSVIETFQNSFENRNIITTEDEIINNLLSFTNDSPLNSSNAIFFTSDCGYDIPSSSDQSGLLFPNGKLLSLKDVFKFKLSQCNLATIFTRENSSTDFNNISSEYISIPTGLYYAGSRAVVASLWNVHPIASTFLMIELYKQYQESPDNVAIALKKAQQYLRDLTKDELEAEIMNIADDYQKQKDLKEWLKDKDEKPFSSPYYWASFYVIGH